MDLIHFMKHERSGKVRGIYWLFQISMAFNSNKIEGSQLSEEQTQHLFDENRIYAENGESLAIDDINETMNHFDAFDYVLDHVYEELSTDMIKHLHFLLKKNTADVENPLTPVGEFKTEMNVIGSLDQTPTTPPREVLDALISLIKEYMNRESIQLESIVDFHVKFEQIHPFADGNGRVGRLIVFKECLKHNIIPSIILDKHRHFYLLGLKEYDDAGKERLIETFKAGQDYSEQILNRMNFEGRVNDSI